MQVLNEETAMIKCRETKVSYLFECGEAREGGGVGEVALRRRRRSERDAAVHGHAHARAHAHTARAVHPCTRVEHIILWNTFQVKLTMLYYATSGGLIAYTDHF